MYFYQTGIQLLAYLLIRKFPCMLANELEVWEHARHSGKTLYLNVTHCLNLPHDMAAAVTSVNTHAVCANLFSGENCTGESIEILGHSPSHGNLGTWGFNDKTRSVGPCLDPCDTRITGPITSDRIEVRGFTEKDFAGSYIDIVVNGCTQVPEAYQNIASIQTYGVCVQLWDNSNCSSKYKKGEFVWNTIELRPHTPRHNNLEHWVFPKVAAVSHCAWKCSSILNNESVGNIKVAKENDLLLFRKINFAGTPDKLILRKGCINLNMESEGQAISVKTGPNVCLTLYDLRNCTGRSVNFIESKNSLQKERFEKVVRSVKYCENKEMLAHLSITEVGIIVGSLLSFVGIFCGVGFNIVIKFKRAISLSEREIREFLEGVVATGETNEGFVGTERSRTTTVEYVELQTAAANLAYNQSHDIRRDQFSLDSQLGSGQFGIVYRGIFNTDNMQRKTVAVKTLKNGSTVTELRCLMKEVKVMLYIKELGTHPNVVQVLGCCTEQLKSHGDLYMIMEYCSNGSLEVYLRTMKAKLQKADTQKQLEWMAEIGSGMEFLSAAKIIHRDLSTRNILLDEGLHSKICDFGLSRQLYENTTYLKKGSEPLAWQWLPLEVLLRSTFTTRSDVWSYGVVCWEIFTLGEVPFAGDNWGKDFIDKVSLGYRLQRPAECLDECYQLMLKCWQAESSSRPDFTQILDEIHHLKDLSDTDMEVLPPIPIGYVDPLEIYV